MKHLRLILLVLLAMLLPMRGAVAVTMLCAPGPAHGQSHGQTHGKTHGQSHGQSQDSAAGVTAPGQHGLHGEHATHAEHAAAQHHGGSETSGDTSADGHAATCPLCAGGCCMATIVGTVPTLAAAGVTAAQAFAALTARTPVFQSDGQDRPPRTS